jgi:hypothetical protein
MVTQKGEIKTVRGYCAKCKSCCPTIAYAGNLTTMPLWKRVSWDEAYDAIAIKLNSIRTAYGAEAVALTRSAF